jgi:outer membrane receptor protein involved in Fe transport
VCSSDLQSSVTFWLLDLKSELVWDADVGGSEPSGPTRRYGIEVANYYVPVRWLAIDADYAWSHARYTDNEAAGDYVPEALAATFDGGVAVHDLAAPLARLEAGLRLRYFGPRSLTQNDSVSSKATTLVYADVGYAITDHWIAGVNIFNLLNTYASDIDYYYVSRLPGEPAAGVADIHTHPAEPREFRATVTYRW